MSVCKHWKKISLCLAGITALLVVTALLFPQSVLLVEDGDVQGDVILLLGGGAGERPSRAAELFRAGAAPRILVRGARDGDGNRLLLRHRGVPSSAIVVEPHSKTMRENTLLSLAMPRPP